MFLSQKLIFLELQKTGGSHIRRLIKDLDLDGSFTKMHDQVDEVKGLKNYLNNETVIIGNVRNPYSWYVSLWAYGCGGEGAIYYRTATWWWRYILSDLRALTIPRKRWKGLYSDPNDPKAFQAWLKMILNSDFRMNIGEDYGDSPFSNQIGFFTYRYYSLYRRGHRKLWHNELSIEEYLMQAEKEFFPSEILKMESLTEDFISCLNKHGFDLQDKLMDKWRSLEKTNSSKHKDYTEYYNDECIELVQKRDGFLMNKHDYSFSKLGSS